MNLNPFSWFRRKPANYLPALTSKRANTIICPYCGKYCITPQTGSSDPDA